METTATTKGQIVIPAAIRRELCIAEGTRIHIQLDKERRQIILTPITPEFIDGLAGKYRGTGVLQALEEDRTWERERDER